MVLRSNGDRYRTGHYSPGPRTRKPKKATAAHKKAARKTSEQFFKQCNQRR
jgi:hypothetical protein